MLIERHRRRDSAILPLVLACEMALAILIPGCVGEPKPTSLVPVRGRVTLDGGPWPGPGFLMFDPVDPKDPQGRIGVALFNVWGDFSNVTWDLREGLPPGHYKIMINCWDPEHSATGGIGSTPAADLAPEPYRQSKTTPLSLSIEPDDGRTELLIDAWSQ